MNYLDREIYPRPEADGPGALITAIVVIAVVSMGFIAWGNNLVADLEASSTTSVLE